MTFSIAARCAETGMLGIAVSSSSPAVAARCAYARAGVGVVATQNITDPTLGPKGLEIMARGADARTTLATLEKVSANITFRQLSAIDNKGGTAAFSGTETLGINKTAEGLDCVAAGNLLDNEEVPSAMVQAFEAARGHLGDRILTAMTAALAAGGEAGSVHSAGLLIVDKVSWPVTDLRVDWHEEDPIGALVALWTLWKPQAESYVTRALNPTGAPSYGVPGDE